LSTHNACKISLYNEALHDRSAFSCGIKAIDDWLKKGLSEQLELNRIRLHCAVDERGKLVGFYALNAHSLRQEEAGILSKKRERRDIPVIYLPAIAVDAKHQSKKLGGALMAHAIEKSVDTADQIGAAALVLDIKEDEDLERRKKFYTRLGFKALEGPHPLRFFLPMKVARLSVEKLKAARAAANTEATII
jgi:GNAT superfamily N-acetyltransferase